MIGLTGIQRVQDQEPACDGVKVTLPITKLDCIRIMEGVGKTDQGL